MDDVVNDKEFTAFLQIGGFSSADMAILKKIGPAIFPVLPHLTDAFYESLKSEPSSAALIEGRIDALKSTHIAWLQELFSGESVEAFIARQEQIGRVHVNAKIPPLYVAASMSFLRSAFPKAITSVVPDADEANTATAALLRILDLCQFLIDRAYLTTVDATAKKSLMDNLGFSSELLTRLLNT